MVLVNRVGFELFNRVEFELFYGKVNFTIEIEDSMLVLFRDDVVLIKFPINESTDTKMIIESKTKR